MFNTHTMPVRIFQGLELAWRMGYKKTGWTKLVRFKSSTSSQRLKGSERMHSEVETSSSGPSKDRISALMEYNSLFPNDTVVNRLIKNFFDLSSSDRIKIGIAYENQKTAQESKLIESILADPLSSGSDVWLSDIKNRPRDKNTRFAYADEPAVELSPAHLTYRLPSPILSASHRPLYANAFNSNRDEFRDIEIWELNRSTSDETFHFYINVSEQSNQSIVEAEGKGSDTLVSIVDNQSYTPFTTESDRQSFGHHPDRNQVLKVNSTLSYDGITQFYEYDVKAADKYLENFNKSNIHELLKYIVFYSQKDQVSKWLLRTIKRNISANIVDREELKGVMQAINENDISEFSEQTHSELQHEMIPKVRSFFKTKLRWWKLYLKNDNVEYDLKEFLYHNFMPSSIEKFNFARGKIVSKLQSGNVIEHEPNEAAKNPLSALKADIINHQIPQEVQPFVYSVLSKALVFYQLPITIISFLSYQYFDYSVNSAVALTALGWVVGFNYISKSWYKFSEEWQNRVFESTRICLGKECINEGLLKELEEKYQRQLKLADIKTKISNAL